MGIGSILALKHRILDPVNVSYDASSLSLVQRQPAHDISASRIHRTHNQLQISFILNKFITPGLFV